MSKSVDEWVENSINGDDSLMYIYRHNRYTCPRYSDYGHGCVIGAGYWDKTGCNYEDSKAGDNDCAGVGSHTGCGFEENYGRGYGYGC